LSGPPVSSRARESLGPMSWSWPALSTTFSGLATGLGASQPGEQAWAPTRWTHESGRYCGIGGGLPDEDCRPGRGRTHPACFGFRWGAPITRKVGVVMSASFLSTDPIDTSRPRIASVQVGRPRDYEWLGRQLRSGIEKHPVTGPVSVLATHLDGDEQADPEHHGGQDKAVYAYASEDLRWWAQTLGGAALDPGVVGENLTTQGMDLRDAVIGEQWRVGSALLQVSEPRTPCWKLGMRMHDPRFPRAFARAGRPGVLLRVLEQGQLWAGAPVTVTHTPEHGVTAADVFALYVGDRHDAERVLSAPELAAHWQKWAGHRTVWHLKDERERDGA